jgi:hypothetical protein
MRVSHVSQLQHCFLTCLVASSAALVLRGVVPLLQLGRWQRGQGLFQGPVRGVRYACTGRHAGCELHSCPALGPAGQWACARPHCAR